MKNDKQELEKRLTRLETQETKRRPIFLKGFDPEENIVTTYSPEGKPSTKTDESFSFNFIAKMLPVLFSEKRYKILASGRSAGKSHGAARWALIKALTEPCRILIARETLSSLEESMYSLLAQLIREDDYLSTVFEVYQSKIVSVLTSSEILFKGLRRDRVEGSIKSIEKIKYCIVEESQTISRVSLQILRPSIRDEGSQILFLINPRDATDPVFNEFIAESREDTAIAKFTYKDNPWCPLVMLAEAKQDYERDPVQAQHVWGGELRTISDECIFSNWIVQEFDINKTINELTQGVRAGMRGTMGERRERRARQVGKIENAFYIGYDHGYIHASASVEVFIDRKSKRIFVLNESYQHKQTLTDIAPQLKTDIPKIGEKWPVSCDHSRPDVIDLLRKNGVNAVKCDKVPIAERIDILKTYLIIVDPKCENMIRELSSYKWQTDKNDNLLPVPKDENNDLLDALSYALAGELRPAPVAAYERLTDPFL